MTTMKINVSGAYGSGTSILIYETPEHVYPWHGARIMHGSYTAGPTAPDSQRIEVVELCLPGLDIRVRADAVRPALRRLLTANEAWEDADWLENRQPARHQAFATLQADVFGLAGRDITHTHIEKIASAAYQDGLRAGEEFLCAKFRLLLGLPSDT